MKIRIKGNSLRYRLTQSEVTRLWEEGFLQEKTPFANGTFTYSIETSGTDSDKLSAGFTDNRIVLYMPKSMIHELYGTDKVGFQDKSGPVSLLVEKDFVCIDNTAEDQSDNYPNPSIACQ